jgi:hypothetical protein
MASLELDRCQQGFIWTNLDANLRLWTPPKFPTDGSRSGFCGLP